MEGWQSGNATFALCQKSVYVFRTAKHEEVMPSKLFVSNCTIHGLVKHRMRCDSGKRCTRCEIDGLTLFRKERKSRLIEMAGGRCIRCGYDKCSEALEFHHRDPSAKSFVLALSGMTKSWERILLEFAKCDLLCRNCHAEAHVEINGGVAEW